MKRAKILHWIVLLAYLLVGAVQALHAIGDAREADEVCATEEGGLELHPDHEGPCDAPDHHHDKGDGHDDSACTVCRSHTVVALSPDQIAPLEQLAPTELLLEPSHDVVVVHATALHLARAPPSVNG